MDRFTVEHVVMEGEHITRMYGRLNVDFDVGEPCECRGCRFRVLCFESMGLDAQAANDLR